MNHTIKNITVALGCLFLILILGVGCGNSSSAAGQTTRELSETITESPRVAVEGAVASTSSETEQPPVVQPLVRTNEESDENPASVRPSTRRRATGATATAVGEANLGVRRLIVARGVENREPVGAGESFEADHERLFAFVEAVNDGGESCELEVVFENADGREVGYITLNVPANVPRWRTWAWSRNVREPGTWTAIIRSSEGTELAREQFEIEG